MRIRLRTLLTPFLVLGIGVAIGCWIGDRIGRVLLPTPKEQMLDLLKDTVTELDQEMKRDKSQQQEQ